MNTTRAVLAAAVLTIAIAAAGCSATHHPPANRHAAPAARPAAQTATRLDQVPGSVPALPWEPSPAAIAAARRYATAALSYTWSRPADSWIEQVTPLCTPQWAATLRNSADGGTGGRPATITAHQTATATVLAVYPSAGPGPGQRLEVTARVAVTAVGQPLQTVPAVLSIDLLDQPDGAWLVAWTQ